MAVTSSRPFNWRSVGGIFQWGGTIIGTARSEAFRTVAGRRQAAANLVNAGIDGMVVVGGDGSLTGALILYQEWADHLKALAAEGRIPPEKAANPAPFRIVGLPGSIDNDQYGTDMSIGADTALNTIVEAVDKLSSTADSHRRTFVVEVMGRRCGYLALMSALATGADWVLIPEEELDTRWHYRMVDALKRRRAAGRRHDLIIFAGRRAAQRWPADPGRADHGDPQDAHGGRGPRDRARPRAARRFAFGVRSRAWRRDWARPPPNYLAGSDPTPVMIGLVDNRTARPRH